MRNMDDYQHKKKIATDYVNMLGLHEMDIAAPMVTRIKNTLIAEEITTQEKLVELVLRGRAPNFGATTRELLKKHLVKKGIIREQTVITKRYALSFTQEGRQGPITAYWVYGQDDCQVWSDSPDSLVVYDEFNDLMETINNMIAVFRDPKDSLHEKALIGTVREDEPHYGDNLIDAIIMTTAVGSIIKAGGEFITNEIEIKPVMKTSFI